MANKKLMVRCLSVATAVLVAGVAHAEPPAKSMDDPASMEAQISAMKQGSLIDQMDQIDAQISFINKQNELHTLLKSKNGETDAPKIISVVIDGTPSATILTAGRMIREIHIGDTVGDFGRVVSIDTNGVKLKDGRKMTSLSFVTPVAPVRQAPMENGLNMSPGGLFPPPTGMPMAPPIQPSPDMPMSNGMPGQDGSSVSFPGRN